MWEMRPGFFTQEKTMAIQEKGKRVFYIPASNENPHPQLVDVLRVHDDGKTAPITQLFRTHAFE